MSTRDTKNAALQPALDAGGEWREDASNPYLIIDSRTKQVVVELFPADRGDREAARRLTAKIVSDHTLAASVPKLVEALRETRRLLQGMAVLVYHEDVIPHIPGDVGDQVKEWLKSRTAEEALEAAQEKR